MAHYLRQGSYFVRPDKTALVGISLTDCDTAARILSSATPTSTARRSSSNRLPSNREPQTANRKPYLRALQFLPLVVFPFSTSSFVFHKIMPPLDLYSFLLDGRDTFFLTQPFYPTLSVWSLPSSSYILHSRIRLGWHSMGVETRKGLTDQTGSTSAHDDFQLRCLFHLGAMYMEFRDEP